VRRSAFETVSRSVGASGERLWATALGLALGPAVALGLARFAYGLLLPSMRADLSWSFAQAGAMNTANAVGYLAGALITAPLTARLGVRRAFIASLVLTAGARGMRAVRSVPGPAGPPPGGGRHGGGDFHRRSHPRRPPRERRVVQPRRRGVGVYVAGGGLGVAVSGLLIPPVVTTGADGWRWGWVVLGGLAFAATAGAARAAHRVSPPAEGSSEDRPTWRPAAIGVTMAAYRQHRDRHVRPLVGLQPPARPATTGLLVAPAARLRLSCRGPRRRQAARRARPQGLRRGLLGVGDLPAHR